MSNDLKIILALFIGTVVGYIISMLYYEHKVTNLKLTIDVLRLQISSKDEKDDSKTKIIKG